MAVWVIGCQINGYIVYAPFRIPLLGPFLGPTLPVGVGKQRKLKWELEEQFSISLERVF